MVLAGVERNMSIYSDYEAKLISFVEEHGWQFTYVFDPEGMESDFGYSVGFSESLHAPEFIVFGLPKKLMNNMLWEIYRQVRDGVLPKDGMRLGGLLEGFDCILRKAEHKDLYSKYVTSSSWLWRKNGNAGEPEVYQVVWPGSQQGLFPWQNGCAQDVIDAQPNLWLPE